MKRYLLASLLAFPLVSPATEPPEKIAAELAALPVPTPAAREAQLTRAPMRAVNGFYSNAPAATGGAASARAAAAGAVRQQHLDVAPAVQLRDACLRECLRMGYPKHDCDKGCER